MNIELIVAGNRLSATLNHSPAALAFYAQLPLELELNDFADKEKIANLPFTLPTEHEPAGTAAKRGDLTYYAPWGNLAIFYQDFTYAAGLIHLGHITDQLNPLALSNKLHVRIEPA